MVWAVLEYVGTYFGSFLKDPWLGPWGCLLEVSNPNKIVYEFSTSQMNFTENEYIKLDKTYLDTHGRFKAIFSNVMDVLRRLTSKLTKLDTQIIYSIITN